MSRSGGAWTSRSKPSARQAVARSAAGETRLARRWNAGSLDPTGSLSCHRAQRDVRIAPRRVVPYAASAPTLNGDPAHPDRAHGHWVDTRLYFGLGPADQPGRGNRESRWREFLDREVTPRFPTGSSVADVYGQWQGKGQPAPERLRSKVLIIDYPDSAGESRQGRRDPRGVEEDDRRPVGDAGDGAGGCVILTGATTGGS